MGRIRFNNDYNRTAHPRVLEAILNSTADSYEGYGADEMCKIAEEKIRLLIKSQEASVYFFPGATQANYIVTTAALSPVQSVICADSGHINCHEAASVEKSGHKIIALPNVNGKITAGQIEAEAQKYFLSGEAEYLTEPHMVYISFATEWGTLYSLDELTAISDVCHKYGMLLFLDGARLGYAIGAEENDVKITDLSKLCDVFYIGGTKCGCIFGEALIIINPDLKPRFRTYMKQNGAVMAKGWIMGIQFAAILENNLYFEITQKADELAMQIKGAFRRKGIREVVDSPTNQQFVVLTAEQKALLSKYFIFEEMGDCVRFCTSWATKQEEVDLLIKEINKLP